MNDVTEVPEDGAIRADVVIIGSGMGGSAMAWALKDSGADVLLVERGDFLPSEPQNSDPTEMYIKKRYRNAERWIDGSNGKEFDPGVYYYVGGNTKFYGAALPRFRKSDFVEVRHHDGTSPAWPFSYDDLEPFYTRAEQLLEVHGDGSDDPTEPPRSAPYPEAPLEHEPEINRFARHLRGQGLHPFKAASAMHLRTMEERRQATTSDGCPSEHGYKGDAENRLLRPAQESGSVRLLTDTEVLRLDTSDDGRRVASAHALHRGRPIEIIGERFVMAAGAVNTASLLLASADRHHPGGLANGSGLLGRNYMVHNSTFFVAVDPRRPNPTLWQKTLGLNDWYESGPGTPYPLGNLQMLGKLQGAMIKGARAWVPIPILDFMARRSLDIYLTTEDLPRLDNRVRNDRGRIVIDWTPNNMVPHRELVKRVTKLVRGAGYPLVFTQRMGIETNSHQCGTAVAGHDPATSVLDPTCRAHEISNLWIADSSFFPSSAALNPALTIVANALRIAPEVAA
ncbi:GMC oxidoreductase [Brachybacterium sp.]|uniref:GMC oxidoreductase n=1 Tax=Brachybacterium sp. TaxID=1891286 RepID=UPI003F92C0B3